MEHSEIFDTLNVIMDKAVEKMNEAGTTDEVAEAAEWYYDQYWSYALGKSEAWSSQYTQTERELYDQREKEFVKLIRTQYTELGGSRKNLQKLLQSLMIKCMRYDQTMKEKMGDNTPS